MKLFKDDIFDYLDDNEKLRSLAHHTIDQWILDAPYSYLFHFIKAKKYVVEGQEIPKDVLHLVATYSNNRRWLRAKLFDSEVDEKLDLTSEPIDKQIDTKNKKQAIIAIKKDKIKKPKTNSKIKKLTKQNNTQLRDKPIITHSSTEEQHTKQPKSKVKLKKLIKTKQESNKRKQQIKGKKSMEKQQKQKEELVSFEADISSFTSWLKSMELETEAASSTQKNKDNSSKKKKKKKKRSRLEKMLQKSLHLKQGIVSETYADLLLEQGHTKRAIEMYKALIMKYPEKSNIFASKLGKIEKK